MDVDGYPFVLERDRSDRDPLHVATASSSVPQARLRQLSADRGVPVPRLKRELSAEGMKLARQAMQPELPERASARARVASFDVSVGDHVLAPYDGEYYPVEVVRIDSNRHSARVLFTGYGEFATVPVAHLSEAGNAASGSMASYEYGDEALGGAYDDDFSPMNQRVGGGGGGGGTIYSQKHIRAREQLLSAPPKVSKGPQSSKPKATRKSKTFKKRGNM